MNENLKPKKRSKLRLALGKRYFTGRRYLYWLKQAKFYATVDSNINLGNSIFEHKTPLRRELKDVEQFINDNKIKNLKIAIERINGTVIKPNDVFSYWRLIGKPTQSKGYVEGMVLDHGKYKLGVGGGLCQLSNLIFWMTLHTPLEVIERHRHSYDVFPDSKRTQPFGSGATCVYNYRDLQIQNSTNDTYQIKLQMDDEYLYGEIVSNKEKCFHYDIYEASHEFSQAYWGGYIRHNAIFKKVYDLNSSLIENQFVCENHAIMMYSPLLSPPTSF